MNIAKPLKDAEACAKLLERLDAVLNGKQLRFMEVCGTHTVAIFHSGLRDLLPKNITHLSGPGCPVCVTHDAEVATFLALAQKENVIVATFGDVLRIPSPDGKSLKHAQAEGARIEVVYSPMDALQLAQKNPQAKVVFLGIGFETTAPTVAATLLMAKAQNVENLLVFSCHKLVPPALRALLDDAACSVDAFLLPGHVSTILGLEPYAFLADYQRPGIVAGFEATDILLALVLMAQEIRDNTFSIHNAYMRAVDAQGNPKAQSILEKVFTHSDALWRGLGSIPMSGLSLNEDFAHYDALQVLGMQLPNVKPLAGCRCGEVLKGKILPPQCPLFAKGCTPAAPIGPCMVSTEGSCAAYFKYRLTVV